jgi:hypothetical protein
MGNSYGDHIGVFASRHESSVAFTESDLCFPADVLDDFGLFFESQLQVPADLGRVARGPGAFDENPPGMRVRGATLSLATISGSQQP